MAAAAREFGLPGSPVPLGGATGSTWGCGHVVLRFGAPERLDREVLAMKAASAALPVPAVLDRRPGVLLLQRLPGVPAAQSRADPEAVGRTCASVHTALAEVRAPADLGAGVLLHLDLHPFNVLVDVDTGALTGVLDWANCAAGDPALDRARTWSILTLDPGAHEFRRDPRAEELCAVWAAGLDPLDDGSRAWACERMLADLAHRYPPERLAHVHQALEELTRRR